MKKIKTAMLSFNTKIILSLKNLTQPLKNNKGSHVLEVVGTVLIALILLAIFLKAMQGIMNDNMAAASSKMTGLFS